MWKRLEVDKTKQYQVALIQEPNGKRHFALVLAGVIELPSHSVFVTEVVPYDLLWRQDILEIAETILLTIGEPFVCDAHGIWFTQEEIDAWNRNVPVPWVNNLPPPNLAPC